MNVVSIKKNGEMEHDLKEEELLTVGKIACSHGIETLDTEALRFQRFILEW